MIDKFDDRFKIAEEYGFSFTPPCIVDDKFVIGKLKYLDTDIVFDVELFDGMLASTGFSIRQCIEELVTASKYQLKQLEEHE